MSRELVGYENLPNAFIKEIKLNDYSENQIEMSVIVVVKDSLQEGGYIWSDDEFMSPMIRVGLICATDESTIGSLSSGVINPLSNEVLSMRKSRRAINETSSGQIIEFVHTFSHVYSKNISNLTIFSFCFIEESNIKTYGPIKSEKVIENSNINGKTFVFRKPDGSLWPGPVHEHNGTYMAGSVHTNEPHSMLMRETIGNFKIKNFLENKPTNSVFQRDKSGAFSDLYVCMDMRTDVKGMFYINVENIFINNSKYSRFITAAPMSVVRHLLTKLNIKSLKINRKRYKSSQVLMENINIINSSDENGVIKNLTRVKKNNIQDVKAADLPSGQDRDPNKIYPEDLTRENIISEVREVFMSHNYNIRGFQFTDKTLEYNTSGEFKYDVSITFEDPTFTFIEQTYNLMKKDISDCKIYVNFKSRHKNYNFKEDRLKPQFRNYEQVDLRQISKNYAKFYFYVFEGDQRTEVDLATKSYSLLSPNNSTLSDSRIFLERYEKLYSQFVKYLDKNDAPEHNTTGRFKVKNNARVNIFTIENKFRPTMVPSKNRYRINYLDTVDTDHFKTYTKNQFSSRISAETGKFFTQNPNFIAGIYGSLQYSKLQGLNDIVSNSTQYLSPTHVAALDVLQSHERIENINNQSLNSIIQDKIYSSIDNNLHVGQYDQSTSQTKIKFVPVSDILTSASIQSYYTNNETEPEPPEKLISEVSYGAVNTNLNSKDLYKKDFDILNSEFPMNNLNTALLPLQIKALLGSLLSSTNNGFLKAEVDAIADPRTRNMINLNFLAPQSIKFLKGYVRGSDGFVSLKGTHWQPLTLQEMSRARGPILCKMERYLNQGLKIDVELDRVFNVVDEYFIISDKNISTKNMTTIEDSNIYEFEDLATFEYTNSNPVTQTNEGFFFYKVSLGLGSDSGEY